MPVPHQANILLVDDEAAILKTLSLLLQEAGWQVRAAAGGMEALNCLDQDIYDLMITDLRMPDLDGLSLFQKAKAKDPLLEVIFISAYADLKSAVQAVKNGAFDYIHKSFTPDELLLTVQKALEHRHLHQENRKLKRALNNRGNFQGMIAKSQEMQELADMVERVAETKATVLISGESGVGKGMVARAIHSLSTGKDKPLVTINCGAIAETLVESELFGYEKGAFTGALRTTPGKFEQAHQGTVFLDEIGELPLASQVRFLRVLQEKVIQRVGGSADLPVDVRVIAATNRNLEARVAQGKFREDLFYRLNVVHLSLPRLSQRKEDIPLLAKRFLGDYAGRYEKNLSEIDLEVLYLFMNHPWPGNVRQLQNTVERAVVMAGPQDRTLRKKHLPRGFAPVDSLAESLNRDLTLRELENLYIDRIMEREKGNKAKVARILDINRQTLYNRLKVN